MGLISMAAAGDSPGLSRAFTGTANSPETKELLYTEHHRERVGSDGTVEIETIYKDPTGVSFATRSVWLAADGYLPAYDFLDSRTGYEEGIRIHGDRVVMYRKRPGRAVEEEKPVAKDGALVADAGFDRLIATKWNQLSEGEGVEALLVVPSRLRSYRFSVEMVDESDMDGVPVTKFRMRFSNPILRLLAPKIFVSYDRREHFIVAYEGKSSLEDPGGGNYDVTVRYTADDSLDAGSGGVEAGD